MGESTQEILIGNPDKHEKGEPDGCVKHKGKSLWNIEVTGSFINIGNNDIWLRPDKVQWAINHPEVQTWAYFVYKDKILRFCINEAVDFPIEERKINGTKEFYHIIPQSEAFEFTNLSKWKET